MALDLGQKFARNSGRICSQNYIKAIEVDNASFVVKL